MSVAESRPAFETQMPEPGTIRLLDKILDLEPSQITSHEQLLDFLKTNELPESLSFLAVYHTKLPDEVRLGDVSSGQWLLDSRQLSTCTEDLPTVRVIVSNAFNCKASLNIHGQSADSPNSVYNAYELTIPLCPGDATMGGLGLSIDPKSQLYAQLSKKNGPANSNGNPEVKSGHDQSRNQLGPVAVKSFGSRVFNTQSRSAPTVFVEALKMAASDLAICFGIDDAYREQTIGQ
jgi:hypothetical protein